MELGELIRTARVLLDDAVEPYFYEEQDLVQWYNSAVREACIRMRGLQDDSSALAQITLVPDQARYTLHPKVLAVRAAYVPGRRQPLDLVNSRQLDRLAPGWAHEVGRMPSVPRWAVFDLGQRTIHLEPAPREEGVMKLILWRLPLEEQEFEVGDDSGEPAIEIPDPTNLKHWVAFEAYSVKDSEKYDPERAKMHLGLFDGLFGTRPSNHDIQLWSQSRLVGQRMHSEF